MALLRGGTGPAAPPGHFGTRRKARGFLRLRLRYGKRSRLPCEGQRSSAGHPPPQARDAQSPFAPPLPSTEACVGHRAGTDGAAPSAGEGSSRGFPRRRVLRRLARAPRSARRAPAAGRHAGRHGCPALPSRQHAPIPPPRRPTLTPACARRPSSRRPSPRASPGAGEAAAKRRPHVPCPGPGRDSSASAERGRRADTPASDAPARQSEASAARHGRPGEDGAPRLADAAAHASARRGRRQKGPARLPPLSFTGGSGPVPGGCARRGRPPPGSAPRPRGLGAVRGASVIWQDA